MTTRFTFALVLVFLLTPLMAQGQILLDGQTVQGWYLFDTIGSIHSGPLTAVVGSGIEFPTTLHTAMNLDISDTNLYATFTFTDSVWSDAAFNGFRIFDVNGTIPAFSSVLVNGATSMGGFDASRVTFDADNIWVNWQGLGFNQSTIVSLDVNGGSEIPEPSTMLLMGMGAMAILAFRSRLRS